MRAPLFVHRAGGLAADGARDLANLAPRTADAAPVPLRELAKAHGLALPRLGSRFTELADLGARIVLGVQPTLPAASALYLASGLGDIARTDALYYQVMPPVAEMASPVHFASSGNNIASFFVARDAGLTGRNLTVSSEALSFERALALASSDLADGVAPRALVGAVDETTVPRDFYTRRFPLAESAPIGEASVWFELASEQGDAIGTSLAVDILPPAQTLDVERVVAIVAPLGLRDLVVLPGLRVEESEAAQIARRLGGTVEPYLARTGCFPTAAALMMAVTFAAPRRAKAYVHVARDRAGRTGLIAWQVNANE